jgi:hypothetical protein
LKAPADPSPRNASLKHAAVRGALGFGLASLVVFGTVAFGEGWMYRTLGLYGSYAAWTLLLVLAPALTLRSLVTDPARRRTFPVLFAAAFFLYAIGWMAAYFLLRKSWGEQPAEVAASLVGSALLAGTLAAGLGALQRFGPLFGLIFAANTTGYFLGGALYFTLGRPVGMLLWGVAYGVLLGAALGAVIVLAGRAASSTPSTSPLDRANGSGG